MARIVIVDDDQLVLYAVSSYLHAAPSLHTVEGTFTDPVKAAAFLTRNPCDILITDIKMPQMSGFQLIEEARSRQPGLGVLVLSAHADFALARDAISLKVDEYLLKHEIDRETLLAALARCVQSSGAAPQPAGEQGGIAGLLRCAGNGSVRGGSAETMRHVVSVFQIKHRYDDQGRETASSPNLAMLARIIEESLRRSGDAQCCVGSHQDIVIVHAGAEDLPIERQPRILQHLRDALAASSRYLNFRAFIATAERPHPEGELDLAYREACSAACTAFFLTENALILPSMIGSDDEAGYEIPDLAPHESFLPESWRERVDRFFSIPFRRIKDGARRMKLHVTVALEDINSLLLRSYGTSFEEIIGETAGALYERVFRIEDETALRALLDDIGARIGETISRNRHTRSVVGSVQAYIERNYARPLSLAETASIFNIGMSYLCTLFRQETGKHFTDYVHRVRLRHACQLFADRSLSLKEIAFAVGYQSSDHFSRVFTRIMGDTATAWRERIARGDAGDLPS